MLLPTKSRYIRVEEAARTPRVRYRDREWVFPREDCVLLPIANTTAELLGRYIGQRLLEVLRRDHKFVPEILAGGGRGELRPVGDVRMDENQKEAPPSRRTVLDRGATRGLSGPFATRLSRSGPIQPSWLPLFAAGKLHSCVFNYGCAYLFLPLNKFDCWLGTGRPPAAEPMWGMSLNEARQILRRNPPVVQADATSARLTPMSASRLRSSTPRMPPPAKMATFDCPLDQFPAQVVRARPVRLADAD